MTKELEMEQTLLALRDFLSERGFQHYAQYMHDMYHDWKLAESREERSDVARMTKRVFGGVGSFNDLVLGTNEDRQLESNAELSSLRKKLGELVHYFIH